MALLSQTQHTQRHNSQFSTSMVRLTLACGGTKMHTAPDPPDQHPNSTHSTQANRRSCFGELVDNGRSNGSILIALAFYRIFTWLTPNQPKFAIQRQLS